VTEVTADIVLTIPSSVVETMRLPPDDIKSELVKELALALYSRGIITSAQACTLTGISRWEFDHLLFTRKVPVHYSREDLDEDCTYAGCNL